MTLFHHFDLRVMCSDADPAGIVWFGAFFRRPDEILSLLAAAHQGPEANNMAQG